MSKQDRSSKKVRESRKRSELRRKRFFATSLERLEDRSMMAIAFSENFESYTGAGFQSSPTAGQLDSDLWAATGMSDGDLAFGGTRTTASTDYTRGTQTAAFGTGGFFAYSTGSNNVFAVQPTGSDWSINATLTLRVQNDGTATSDPTISFDRWVRNDQARSSLFNVYYSTDNSTYAPISSFDYTSTATADALGFVNTGTQSTTLTGVNIAANGYLYLRWIGGDVSGSGNRDEFGIDNVSVTATGTASFPPTISSSSTLAVDSGAAVTFNVVAAGSPTPTFSTTGMPAWLSLDTNTGLLTGTAPTVTALQSSTFDITATNSQGSATQSFTITAIPTAISYAVQNDLYSQDFNTLPFNVVTTLSGAGPHNLQNPTGVNASGTPGWFLSKTGGTGPNALFDYDDGTFSGGKIASYGASSDPERALGSLSSSTTISRVGAVLVNNTGATLNEFTLGYRGEQWRVGTGTGVTNSLAFSYALGGSSIDSGTFVSDSGLNFDSKVISTGTGAALNGNDSANQTAVSKTISGINWLPGEKLVLRWDDADNSGQDDALAIDDLTFSARALAPTAPTITSAAQVGVITGTAIGFTVTSTAVPAATYSLSGAPGWLSIDTNTGVLSGTSPAVSVPTPVAFTVTATNGVGSPAVQNFTVNVIPTAVSYATASSNYTQNFDGLPSSGSFSLTGSGPTFLSAPSIASSGIHGWSIAEGSAAPQTVKFTVDDGSSSTGSAMTYGTTATAERALGSLASGSHVGRFGMVLVNDSAQTLDQFTLSYTGEQWRSGAPSAVNRLAFSYLVGGSDINTGTFNAATVLDFVSPAASGTTDAAINGNDPLNRAAVSSTVTGLNWLPGQTLVLRWDDANETGNDDGLAIDDLTFIASPFVATAPTITSTATATILEESAFTFNVTSTGAPAATYSATGLPGWLSLDTNTGALSGTAPSVAADETLNFTITATNGTLPDASQNFTLTVQAKEFAFTGNYSQSFDGLITPTVPADNTPIVVASVLPKGWSVIEAGTNANASIRVDNGSSGTGDSYLFGATGDNERSLGSSSSGSLTSMYGLALTNSTGFAISQLQVSFRGEQWKNGISGSAVNNSLTFEYGTAPTSLGDLTPGAFNAFAGLNFTAPQGGNVGADTALDGNDPLNQTALTGVLTGLSWAPGTVLYLRWTDINETGNDDGLGIDDLVLTVPNSSPTFDDQTYTVPRNLTVGTPVAIVAPAVDLNGGDVLTYSLLGGSASQFTFDPVTRIVRIAPGANLVSGTNYVLQLQVSDGTVTDDATITINVTPNVQIDFGDAPAGYGTATAMHAISFGPILGNAIDYEASSLVNATASGDDAGNTDDEDGLSPTGPLSIGIATTFTVSLLNVPGTAQVQAWFDLNGDGDFTDAGEELTSTLQNGGVATADGTLTFTFTPTAKILDDTNGNLFARIRASSLGNLTPSSGALDGEIEDYRFTFTGTDFGDALATYGTEFTAHVIAGPRLGTSVDAETKAPFTAASDGDGADENGVVIPALAAGAVATLTVNVENMPANASGAAKVQMWIDTDGSGAFDAGDAIFPEASVNSDAAGKGTATFLFTPPSNGSGTYIARFRVSTLGGLASQGTAGTNSIAADGEMEDYRLTVNSTDYSDAPSGIVGTSFAYGTASHLSSGAHLGATVTAETSATTSDSSASSDASDDGILFASTHLGGTAETLAVTVVNATADTRLDVFADLNADGDFADAGEAIYGALVGAGASVSVNVPFTPTTAMYRNPAFAILRFRVSESATPLTATGAATSGEVEDYKIVLADSFDFGDLPSAASGAFQTDGTTPLDFTAILGASHKALGVTLGARVDAEAAAIASAAASGDDLSDDLPASLTNVDDEDGVTWSSATVGVNLNFTVNVANLPSGDIARVNAWIDWNRDGDFDDTVDGSSERVYNDVRTATGAFTFSVLPTVAKSIASGGVLYARFRIASDNTVDGPDPMTASSVVNSNGEIEDYRITLTGIDFGDLAPSSGADGATRYDTINTTHGRPASGNNPQLGANVDAEATVVPNIAATADGADDDGVTLSSILGVGVPTTVTVSVANVNGSTVLMGWFDLNNDGDFADSGENVLNKQIAGNGDNTFLFTPTASHARFADGIAARFRIATGVTTIASTGAVANGEIEDYRFLVQTDGGDAWPATGSGVLPDGYGTSITGHTAIGPQLGNNRDYDLTTSQTVTPSSVTFGTPATTITVPNGVGGLFVGMTVTGTGLAAGTRITAIDAATNKVTINLNTTAASSGSYTFTGSGFGGQSTVRTADNDDATGGNDEDGVTLPTLFIGNAASGNISVQNVTGAGAIVKAWADLNGDGDFGDSGEEILNTTVTTLGTSSVPFSITPTLELSQNPYLRVRIAEAGTTLNATGFVGSGEVEDHRLAIQADLGDGPVSYGLVGHGLNGVMLGATRDQDGNTTFSALANGDDTTGNVVSDEDALVGSFITVNGVAGTQLIAGVPNTITVNVSNVSATLGAKVFAWIDLDNNGSFSSGEQLAPKSIAPGQTSATFAFTPAFDTLYRSTGGAAFLRLRAVDGQTTTSLAPSGSSATGEVEDHRLTFAPAKDFGDSAAHPAASHTGLGATLGVNIDHEFAQRTSDDGVADATPIDAQQIDDEDGLVGSAGTAFNVYDGLTTTFTLNVRNVASNRTALVKAWLDLNGDGDFADSGEEVLSTQRTANGAFTFTVRPTVEQRGTFSGASVLRVRVQDFATGAASPTLLSTGDAPRGEVEDHVVNVKAAPEVLVSVNDNGTPTNLTDDILEIKDNVGVGTADNNLTFKMVTESNVQKLQITSNVPGSAIFVANQSGATGSGTNVVRIPLLKITQEVRLNMLGGHDTVTLDTSGGDFLTASGWNIQMGSGTDTLDVVGSNTKNLWTISNPAESEANAGTLQLGLFGTATIGGLEIADGSEGADTFKVTSAAATGLTFYGDGGVDTVEVSRDANFTLTNTLLSLSTGPSFSLGGDIENAKLTGGIGTNTFNLNGWSGASAAQTAILTTGGGNDVVVKNSADDAFTLETTKLTAKLGAATKMTATLSGTFKRADLTSTAATSTFDVSNWYQAANLVAGGGTSDVLKITRNFSTATLKDTEFSSGVTPKMTLSGFDNALITGGKANNALQVGGWTKAITFDGLGGSDTISVSRSAPSFTAASNQPNNGSLTIGSQSIGLTGVEAFSITADDGANTFDVSNWSGGGKIFGKGGNDKVVVNKATPAAGAYTQADFTLTNSLLTTVTKTDAPGAIVLTRSISLASVETADLTGGSIANKFNLLPGWTGGGSITAGTGSDVVSIARDTSFVVSGDKVVMGGTSTTNLSGVETLNLTGGAGGNSFTVNDDWTAALAIDGGAGLDKITVNSRNVDYSFTNVVGSTTKKILNVGSQAVAIDSIESANLIGGAGDNTFNFSNYNGADWTGSAKGLGGNDTVVLTRDANLKLEAAKLSVNGKAFALAEIEKVELYGATGTTAGNTYAINGWTGGLKVDGRGGSDAIEASGNANFTLNAASLQLSTVAGPAWDVLNIEKAQLTGGTGNNTFTLTGWAGEGKFSGGTGTDVIVTEADLDMTLSNALLKVGTKSYSIGGFEAATLTGGASANFLNAKDFKLGGVTLNGLGGNDVLWGGSGNDVLNGDANDDVLVGNNGADALNGGTGRDILIGGENSAIDVLNGNDGDDILIGGRTTYDANKTAQDAFLAAWASTVNSYADRVTLLRDTGVGSTNQFKLNKANAPNDGAIDQIFGNADQDWFFADNPGSEALSDKAGNETVTDTAV